MVDYNKNNKTINNPTLKDRKEKREERRPKHLKILNEKFITAHKT